MIMTWLVTLVAGALIGWIASLIMGTDAQMGALANVLVGIVGSILGKYLFADLLGIGGATAAGSFSIGGIIWGVVGAVILIYAIQLITHRRTT